MQKTDEYIENRLIWKAKQYGLPTKFAFYFIDLASDFQKDVLAKIDVTASGNPVLFFTRPTQEWTLICTRQVIASDTKGITKLALSDIKQISPIGLPSKFGEKTAFNKTIKKTEWNELNVVGRDNQSYVFCADKGVDLFSLWNILLMAKRITDE